MLDSTGLRLVRVPVDDQGIDVAALARTEARSVLVTPAHQYPTGVVLSPTRRAELIAWARDVDGLVIEDDYDAEFRYDREPVGCLQGIDPDRVVLLGSVSKALAPALRLGWAVAPSKMADRLRTLRAQSDLGAPVLEQHALAHFISTGAYDRHLRMMRRTYRARRDALVEALHGYIPEVAVRGVSAGIHLYVELPPGTNEEAVVAAAARVGLSVAGASHMWSRDRATEASPALVLGYARLGENRLARAAELLGDVITGEVQG
jgi:GntR family transcriptional regulator/MocR family aminotransferase